MDKLQECAKAFEKLLTVKYNIIIARKTKQVNITLQFDKVDFHHLAGLHKLQDIRISRANRTSSFDNILNNKINFQTISSSRYISQVSDRLEPLAHIENLLDSNELVFKYNTRTNTFSLIQADYLLSTPYSGNDVYIFLSKNKDNENYFCRSFFPKDKKDYTIGQAQYILLYKEKINLITGKEEIQFNRLYGYKIIYEKELESLKKSDIKIDTLSKNGNEISIRYFLQDENKINSVLQQYRSKKVVEQVSKGQSTQQTAKKPRLPFSLTEQVKKKPPEPNKTVNQQMIDKNKNKTTIE